MKTKILGLLAVGLLVGPMSAGAMMISSSPLVGVSIGAATYDVTFWQDDDGFTSATQAAALPLTFTTLADATVARDSVYAALLANPSFDFSPANDSPVFYIFYTSTALVYCNVGAQNCGVDGGGFSGALGSFATFARSAAVPEPGSLALLGLGLAGLGLSRRKAA